MKLKKYFMTFILFLLLNIFLIPSNNTYFNSVEPIEYFDRVKNTEYHDWSEAKILNQDYSFSTIYLTEKTEFKILKNAGSITWNKSYSGKELPDINKMGKDEELIMLVTNCAVNKNGDVLDVLVKINNVVPYESNGTARFNVASGIVLLESQKNPANDKVQSLHNGDPVIFNLLADKASCDYTMTYYKHGTYNYETNSGELGNISLVNGLFLDLDVPDNNYQNKFLKGNEGIRPNTGSSIIYYNKSGKQPTNTDYQNAYLQEIDNGIAVKSMNTNTNGVWYATSALVLTRDLSNSTYSFTYGGRGCGISFHFSSPYPYEVPNPTKKASLKEVSTGQSFTYDISQYIPNNYYANLFNFSEMYNNLYSNSRFTKIIIKDKFNDFLDINKNKITVTNETGVNVTDKFNIALESNNLVVTAKQDNFNDSTFYSHTYTVHVPVTLKDTTSGIANLKNTATVTSKIGEEPDEDKPSNEVNVDIIYKLIVNYLKEGTNDPVSDPKTLKYKLNDNYTTDYPTINNLELVKVPDNASGIVTGNLVVNYYYREPIIENPDTGAKSMFIIILSIPLLGLIYYFKKYHKKLFKI